ncbi:MAG: hypothetical protein ACOVQK_04020 [Cyanobium sp.]|jgi:hypothetical protein
MDPCQRPWTPALGAFLALIPALLTACTPNPKVPVQPPVPQLPKVQDRPDPRPEGASLAPLATPQQVIQAVDVGRPDPFAAVLTPRLVGAPASQQVAIAPGQQPVAGAGQRGLTGQQRPGAPAGSSQGLSPLGVPKGLLFQGVLQSPLGREALVEYAPSEAKAGGTRSGSLRVGDVGTGRDDSLLPPGWRVRAIDVDRGVLVLQAGTQSVTLQL